MSFTNNMYDKSKTQQFVKTSMAPGGYLLGMPKSCNSCFQPNPTVRLQKNGVSINNPRQQRFYAGPVDVESNLYGLEGPPSGYTLQQQCDNTDDQYSCVLGAGNMKNTKNMDTCFLPTEDTRLSNPPATLRGTGINRFNPLCMNPQNNVIFQGQYDVPSRLLAKDNFRPCVPTPAVNTMLPVQKELPRPMTVMGVPAAFTGHLYQYDVCG